MRDWQPFFVLFSCNGCGYAIARHYRIDNRRSRAEVPLAIEVLRRLSQTFLKTLTRMDFLADNKNLVYDCLAEAISVTVIPRTAIMIDPKAPSYLYLHLWRITQCAVFLSQKIQLTLKQKIKSVFSLCRRLTQ